MAGCGDAEETRRSARLPNTSAEPEPGTTPSAALSAPPTALVTSSAATSAPATVTAPPTVSPDAAIPGVVVAQFWGTPGVEEAGWLLVDLAAGATIDGATRVGLYVAFAEVEFCGRADRDGYYKLVGTLPVTFTVEPLVGGQVPYPDAQPPWQGVPRRNARQVRACPTSGANAAHEVADQRAKWESAGVDTYRFTLSWMSMLVAGDFFVTVVDDVPVGFDPADPTLFEGRTDDERASVLAFLPATIDEVFETLEHFADAERFDVSYDPDLGYPVDVRIDDELLSSDDEFEFGVSDLATG